MALTALATVSDLSDREVDTTNSTLATVMLDAASALVRGAAQAPISQTTSTVGLTGWRRERWLDLPGPPVTDVASVDMDSAAVTDYRRVSARLWRRNGWGTDDGPASVQVTLTHGFATVDESIVNIVCDLAAVGIAAAGSTAHDPRVLVESIDDYSVTWSQRAGDLPSAMHMPAATRRWLRSQFGGGVQMVTYR